MVLMKEGDIVSIAWKKSAIPIVIGEFMAGKLNSSLRDLWYVPQSYVLPPESRPHRDHGLVPFSASIPIVDLWRQEETAGQADGHSKGVLRDAGGGQGTVLGSWEALQAVNEHRLRAGEGPLLEGHPRESGTLPIPCISTFLLGRRSLHFIETAGRGDGSSKGVLRDAGLGQDTALGSREALQAVHEHRLRAGEGPLLEDTLRNQAPFPSPASAHSLLAGEASTL
ncbi:hypothetical protein CRG98_019530 [Punica granatum]|uniref:Uncharacterized protein n=1 Tax=Punica granatum TaxID=22663 RepID=A0A2I0JUS7_PUNGR|nr:hypothetical protein CRG98_019530 [Punica granatum]